MHKNLAATTETASLPGTASLSEGATGKLGGLSLSPESIPPQVETDTYSAPEYQFIEYGADGTVSPVSDAVAEKMRSELLARREAILALPSQEDGLNMERVDSYRQVMGAPRKPIRILSPEDYATAERIGELAEAVEPPHAKGQFFPLLDVTIVKRDPEEEQMYGSGITESRLIHEIAHSSGRTSGVHLQIDRSTGRRALGARKTSKTTIWGIRTTHIGFAKLQGSDESGSYLEESYPEFERGKYIAEELGLPDGFVEEKQTGPGAITNKYAIPANRPDGSLGASMPDGAMGAITLELLVARDPALLDAIRANRQSPDELHSVVGGRMDGMVPGLYGELMALDLDDPNAQQQAQNVFAHAYRHLKS